MPDERDWEFPFTGADGKRYRWHYCRANETNTLVPDTDVARRQHERVCHEEVRQAEAQHKREAKQRRLDGLRASREEKRLEKEMNRWPQIRWPL